ncbi:sulfite exporter TauE/SafE family protein [Fructilactobacillus carniphilus]|uniref:Probable membrane transporter protein n=1 Tax=Fructilactobacillus carniphilus TaxID=2940297 RepID=A0ABY5BW12_9LACO|nr:sulfite exporter TauE/SafE family protein [Fructilactobacillus carniphilus]USS90416.1 sulfite exporter TauE/SafE family protein [Fructilactobacillus carniphilus]
MVLQFIFLIAAGIVAGLMATIAGLASIASYPALLMVGIPPVIANVTNTVSLIFTGVGAIPASLKELHGQWHRALGYTILAVIGSVSGSALLLVAPASTFEKIVPFFILVAGVMLLLSGRGKELKEEERLRQAEMHPTRHKVLTLASYLGIVLVGGYLGYFGAAGGVVLLAILAVITRESFAKYNAVKNVMTFACNICSSAYFIMTTTVAWHAVLPLGIGLLIGGFCGPKIVRHVNIKLLRILIAIAAFLLAGDLFVKAYF